jgi:hypothetical protein
LRRRGKEGKEEGDIVFKMRRKKNARKAGCRFPTTIGVFA